MRQTTILATAAVLGVMAVTSQHAAHAQDFFSLFNNAFGGAAPAEPPMRRSFAPFSPFGDRDEPRRTAPSYASGGGSYCVRTCDGRYFPLTSAAGQSKAQACSSFCPASETKVVYGSSIDHAVTESGKAYSDLPNAFKYRTELVSGCTCNGKDPVGLAEVKIDDDKTLRRGDIVAGPNGLMVSNRNAADGRRVSMEFSPASKTIQERFSRNPVVASQ